MDSSMMITSVGFGTAGLGAACASVVLTALQYGFRFIDTAEADYWYNQTAVGQALEDYARRYQEEGDCSMEDYYNNNDNNNNNNKNDNNECTTTSTLEFSNFCEELQISTKIGPWDLTSAEQIRSNAAKSRTELLGFCSSSSNNNNNRLIPLDIYYIHAPSCWPGWHPRCTNAGKLLDLKSAWMAMEAVVGLDFSAKRIGLSNVSPQQLVSIIEFVQERKVQHDPLARMPDVLQAYADPIQPAEELRQICQQYKIEFVSYSTLGTQHSMKGKGNPVLDNPMIQQLAKKYNRSTAEVVLSWAMQNNMSIIPRSSQEKHIAELARLLPKEGEDESTGFLSKDDLALMDQLKYSA